MPRNVIYFEFPAQNPSKIIAFYEKLFGWKLKRADLSEIEYWLVSTKDSEKGPGIVGGLFKKMRPGEIRIIDGVLRALVAFGGVR